jgi:hypothetical protein
VSGITTAVDTVVPMPEFALQFPIERAPEYAGRYAYEDDEAVIAIGRAARERGHYTRPEFISVCAWKSPRTRPYAARNSARAVEEATGVALSATSTERQRVESLRSLHGVEWPTASVFLHLAYPERYPILDQRALQALGVPQPPAYSFRFWDAYVTAWLRLLDQSGLDGRTFDQALWQWSKERGERLR